MKTTTYVCVDIEASGPVPGLYNMLSLGAVAIVDRGALLAPEPEGLYLELQPVFPGFLPSAMKIHGLDPDHLVEHGTPPRTALRRLREWSLERLDPDGDGPVFVGHNAPFDWSYVAYYYQHFGVDNPFGYKALDTKALAMGRLRIPWKETHKERLAKELPELAGFSRSEVHRADEDARVQANILCGLLNLDRR